MITKVIGIIAGYDVLANEISAHREYVTKSYRFCLNQGANTVFLIGGATNPDHPTKTEAGANETIIHEEFDRGHNPTKRVILPKGNTAAEALTEVCYCLQSEIIGVYPMTGIWAGKLRVILCCEKSRLSGFLLDAQQVGLLELATDNITTYGHDFPESGENFEAEKKKMLKKVLSHRYKFFRWLRGGYQKCHQKKVAKLKREGVSKNIY